MSNVKHQEDKSLSCRHCKSSSLIPLVDLGSSPPSNMYLTDQENFKSEVWYPIKVYLCEQCLLVQMIL